MIQKLREQIDALAGKESTGDWEHEYAEGFCDGWNACAGEAKDLVGRPRPPLTVDELADHSVKIGRALAVNNEEAFIAAFSAYVEDCINREFVPGDKISKYVFGLLEGYDAALVAMAMGRSRGGAA